MVRIGCHQLVQGNLSPHIYFLDADSEKQTDYCETVLELLENPDEKRSIMTRSNVDNETTLAKAYFPDSVHLPDLQQCIMRGSEEIGCKDCDIHFYHNQLDRDDIFDPTKSGGVS